MIFICLINDYYASISVKYSYDREKTMNSFSQNHFSLNGASLTNSFVVSQASMQNANSFKWKRYASYVLEYVVAFGISYELERSYFSERESGEYYPEEKFFQYLFVFKPAKCFLSALGVWGVGKLLAEKDSFGKAFIGAVFGELIGLAVAVLSPDFGEYAFFHMPPLFTVIAYNF